MTMNKMFAGLIAFVAGVALSVGSAFATNGYVGGDHANMKLVPYFETGDNRATLIGIQNLSPREAITTARKAASTAAAEFVTTTTENTASSTALITAVQEDADAAAMAADYAEHVFVDVMVYDAMGMQMGSASLCLGEDQFGYVVLQGPAMQDWQMETPNRGMILTVEDGDIPAYGYATVTAEKKKFKSCEGDPRTGLAGVETNAATALAATTDGRAAADAAQGFVVALTTPADAAFNTATSRVSAWTIVQDTGMGFFGTEVPTSTIMMADTDSDMGTPDAIACYDGDADATNGVTPAAQGSFAMASCGLIPARHDNRMVDDDNDETTIAPYVTAQTTPRAKATARYDVGDETMVYVWLGAGMDTEDTKPSGRRMLDVVVKCEDGSVMMASDIDGVMGPIKVAAPGMLTMIDPAMGDVGMHTDMCAGDRGVLEITMPGNSHAGMVFSQITQMDGHYRMNFPGYSMASPDACSTAGTAVADQRAACK